MTVKTREAHINVYAGLFISHQSYIPSDIQPNPELVILKDKLFKMTAQDIRNRILPLFVTKTKASADGNPFSAHSTNSI